MTDAKYHTPEPGSLEGRVFQPVSEQDLREAVELAFDYRGDVTIGRKSGDAVTGYLFNRSVAGPAPWVEVFPSTANGSVRIPFSDIASIAFTGEDTASGKSWEAWVSKKESERREDAARVTADAQARGHL